MRTTRRTYQIAALALLLMCLVWLTVERVRTTSGVANTIALILVPTGITILVGAWAVVRKRR